MSNSFFNFTQRRSWVLITVLIVFLVGVSTYLSWKTFLASSPEVESSLYPTISSSSPPENLPETDQVILEVWDFDWAVLSVSNNQNTSKDGLVGSSDSKERASKNPLNQTETNDSMIVEGQQEQEEPQLDDLSTHSQDLDLDSADFEITSAQQIIDFEVSNDGQFFLLLTARANSQELEDEVSDSSNLWPQAVAAGEDNNNGPGQETLGQLSLVSRQDQSVKVIADSQVMGASFVDEQVLYQLAETEPGLYLYDHQLDTSKELLTTYYLQALDNVSAWGEENFFFVSPATGQLGVLNPDGAGGFEAQVLEQEVLSNFSDYSRQGRFRFVSSSHSGLKVAVYDYSYKAETDLSQEIGQAVRIYEAGRLNDPLIIPVRWPDRGLSPQEEILGWSNDSRYLLAGWPARVIDTTSGQVVLTTQAGGWGLISPDSQKLAYRVDGGRLQVWDIAEAKEQASLDYPVSDFVWLEDFLLVIIEEKLYLYNPGEDLLEKVLAKDNVDAILTSLNDGSQVWVRSGHNVIYLRRAN